MKRTTFIAAILFTGFYSTQVIAQPKQGNPVPQPQPAPENVIDKKINKVDSSIAVARQTFEKTHKTAEEVKEIWKSVFKSKPANEAVVSIFGVEYDDANLQSLLKALDSRKEVKKATMDYTDGVASINLVLKSKAQFDFWNDLPADLKTLFKMKSKKENNLLVEYKKEEASVARN